MSCVGSVAGFAEFAVVDVGYDSVYYVSAVHELSYVCVEADLVSCWARCGCDGAFAW